MSETLELGGWGYFLMTISWIFVTISFIFCCYATYKAYSDYTTKKISGTDPYTLTTQRNVKILTILCMWLLTAISICDAAGFPHWFMNQDGQYEDTDEYAFNWEHSNNSYLMWNVFWALAKVNLYIVYLYRIHIITNTIKYDTMSCSRLYIVLILCLILTQFVFLCLWVYYYNISYGYFEVWRDNQYDILTAIAWVILVLDAVISLILIFWYIVCMKHLFKSLPANVLQMENINVQAITGDNEDKTANVTETAEIAGTSPKDDDDNQGWDTKQEELIETSTRLFVTAFISFASSIFYQLLFGIAITEEFYGTHGHTALYYFSFTWNVDSTLNVICLFLSLSIGKKMYYGMCKCHECCFNCIKNMTTEN
eukprot:281511_1